MSCTSTGAISHFTRMVAQARQPCHGPGSPHPPPKSGGGTTPTLPLLERLASALGLTLTISLTPAGRKSA